MGAYYSGQQGRLFVKAANETDATEIARLQNWSLNYQGATLDTTCLTDKDKTIVPGVRSMTGSATMLYYTNQGDTKSSNVNRFIKYFLKEGADDVDSKDLGSKAEPSQMVRIQLKLDKTGTGKESQVEFYAAITGFTVTCNVGEIVSANITWEGHGAPQDLDL